MALGFGFNKAKVLASAEKYVQQGKLQNAISEYEKIIKEDPKDLTVLNTIGDLNARIGHNDKAVEYFKKVGDAYAAEGFTVKAIAMYKKLSKLNAGEMSSVLRLAELYTAQGLYNDARAQYVQVSESYLKAGKNEDAARIFQKVLELDPDNVAMQTKLADLYMKLGKKSDARNIYLSAAQSLYSKQAMEQADEALARVLSIESNNVDALLLRGTIAAESGDGATAVQHLSQIPDYTKNVNALRAMLRAYLLMSKLDEAGPLAAELIGQFKDLNGLNWYSEALFQAGRHAEALKLYETNADQLIKANASGMQRMLTGAISKVKGSSAALQSVRQLLTKLNDRSHDAELMELLAHAYVTEGKLAPARDLYKELAEAEPENPLHSQNYKQVVGMLGEDSAAKPLSVEQGAQAIMMDAIDPHHQVPVIQHEYPEDVAAAVRAALTDSELFESYNLPPKAIAPLEAGLQKAPRDSQLNVRLATIYAKVNRFADAAVAATIVSEVYAQHGFSEEAHKYAELASQYKQQAGDSQPLAPHLTAASGDSAPPESAKEPAASAGGFRASSVAHMFEEEHSPDELTADAFGDMFGASPQPPKTAAPVASPVASEPIRTPVPPVAVKPPTAPVVTNFEDAFPAEGDPVDTAPAVAAAAPVVEAPHAEAHAEWEEMLVVEPAPAATPVAASEQPVSAAEISAAVQPANAALIDEIRFYIGQSMWTEASAATERLAQLEPTSPLLAEFTAEIKSHLEAAAPAQPVAPEISPEIAAPAPEPSVAEFSFESFSAEAEEAAPAVEPSAPVEEPAVAAAPAVVEAPAPIIPPVIAPMVAPPIPPPVPAVAVASAAPAETEDFLGDLVADLEDSIGDFAPAPPAKAAKPAPPAAPAAPAFTAPPPASAPMAPAAAAAAPAMSAAAESAPVAPIAVAEETSVLSDLFAEFKEGVEESAGEAEDPDTHYNLGIAFKEMGLLDEAIGELQKVCHAVEKGHPFSQPVQAFTWLAQCLVEKDVPQAAVRWYEKALKLPLDEDSRLAVFYDLGNAQELAGNKKAAYTAFMECFSSNIDYRDVADRVKALKS